MSIGEEGGVFPWYSGWGVKLTSHLRLLKMLRMGGAVPLLLLYVWLS